MKPYLYRARLHKVIDGDTVILDVDHGFHLTGRYHFRLVDYDAPERGEPGWAECATRLDQMLSGADLMIRTLRGQSFARWRCEVLTVNGEPVDVHGAMTRYIAENGWTPS